tara:strand:+ start:1591 stop:2916 length:1326 start_codon:yes stop_codon:yes gene_type:complete
MKPEHRIPMPEELSSRTRPRDEDGRWTMFATICIGIAVPAVIFGRATIVPFLAAPILAALLRKDIKVCQFAIDIFQQNRLLVIVVSATIVFWLVSCITSIEMFKSLSTWARTLAIVALGVILTAYLTPSRSRLNLALKSLILTSFGILAFYAIFSVYIHPAPFEIYRLVKGPQSILLQTLKPYYSVAACILPIIVWAGLRLGSIYKILSLLSIPLTLLLIYAKGIQPGLSALFGLSGAALIIVLILALKRLPVLYTRIFVISMCVVTTVSATYVINGLPTPPVSLHQLPELPLPDWHRQVIWGFTIEVIKSTPFLGVGPNTINLSPGAKELIPGLNQEYIPSHPHNWLLEIAAETGLVGLTVFLFAFLLAIQLLITRAIGNNAEALAATALSATFWISSLANFSIWATWWLTIFSVLVSFPLAAMIADHRCKAASKDFTSF